MSDVVLTPDLDADGDGAIERLSPGWQNLLVVCKACEKRGSGPKRMRAKDLAKDLKRGCRDARVPRPRIVLSACMGTCPKKAFTVTAASAGGLKVVAFHRGDDTAAAVAALFPR